MQEQYVASMLATISVETDMPRSRDRMRQAQIDQYTESLRLIQEPRPSLLQPDVNGASAALRPEHIEALRDIGREELSRDRFDHQFYGIPVRPDYNMPEDRILLYNGQPSDAHGNYRERHRYSEWDKFISGLLRIGTRRQTHSSKDKSYEVQASIAGVPVKASVFETGHIVLLESTRVKLPFFRSFHNEFSLQLINISVFGKETAPLFSRDFFVESLYNFGIAESTPEEQIYPATTPYVTLEFRTGTPLLYSHELKDVFCLLNLSRIHTRQFGLGQRRVSFASPQHDKTQTQGGTG
jgi:hypothetical protein